MAARLATVTPARSVAVPLVHSNGTSKQALLDQLNTADRAVCVALKALHDTEPHQRDYYPQAGDAYQRARKEHEDRVRRLVDIRLEVVAILDAVIEQ